MQLKLANSSEDFKFLYNARCHPDVCKTLNGNPPINYDSHLEYIKSVQGISRWIYIAYDNSNTRIGYSQIYDLHNDQLEVGFVIHPDYQGKGFGSQIVWETIKLAQSNYNGYKIVLYVKKINKRATHLYQKYGFTHISETSDSYYMEL